MNTMELGFSHLPVPRMALGCMRIAALDTAGARELLYTALECGINFFDHADIYGNGQCETLFAQALEMTPSLRENVIIQTKCGIRPGHYDLSREHILKSVDGSLKRLQTEYLDVLLLHRPDALVDPDEICEVFCTLSANGKVRYFGVSNFSAAQIDLLANKSIQPLIVNQMQLSLAHSPMIRFGLNVNTTGEDGIDRDGTTLDYCYRNGITVQPYCPMQGEGGTFIDNPKYEQLNKTLQEIAASYGVTREAIAIAWLLRHPAMLQPIIGTTKPERIQAMAKAADITLTREQWYALYRSAGYDLP